MTAMAELDQGLPDMGASRPAARDRAFVFRDVYAFVAEHLVQLYARPIREGDEHFKWCPRWWEHTAAHSRLTALWQAWEALHDGTGTGPAHWWRDYADPTMATLTAPDGPFAHCGFGRHQPPPALPVFQPGSDFHDHSMGTFRGPRWPSDLWQAREPLLDAAGPAHRWWDYADRTVAALTAADSPSAHCGPHRHSPPSALAVARTRDECQEHSMGTFRGPGWPSEPRQAGEALHDDSGPTRWRRNYSDPDPNMAAFVAADGHAHCCPGHHGRPPTLPVDESGGDCQDQPARAFRGPHWPSELRQAREALHDGSGPTRWRRNYSDPDPTMAAPSAADGQFAHCCPDHHQRPPTVPVAQPGSDRQDQPMGTFRGPHWPSELRQAREALHDDTGPTRWWRDHAVPTMAAPSAADGQTAHYGPGHHQRPATRPVTEPGSDCQDLLPTSSRGSTGPIETASNGSWPVASSRPAEVPWSGETDYRIDIEREWLHFGFAYETPRRPRGDHPTDPSFRSDWD